MYLWGAGEYGRLGLDDEQQQNTPSLCMTLQGKGITSISCGGFHTSALASSLGPEGGATLPVYAPRDRLGVRVGGWGFVVEGLGFAFLAPRLHSCATQQGGQE